MSSRLGGWLIILVICAASGLARAAESAGQFRFARSDYLVSERDSSPRITITRDGGTRGRIVVPYFFQDGTAFNGTHYSGIDGEVVFEDFQTSAVIPESRLWPIDNPEPNEGKAFTVSLGMPRPAPGEDETLQPQQAPLSQAVVTVVEPGRGFNFSSPNYLATEWDIENPPSTVTITVTCTEVRSNIVTVDYKILSTYDDRANRFPLQPGSDYAKPGQDFVVTNGTLTFEPDETEQEFEVTIIDDQLVEFNEDFRIILEDPDGEFYEGTNEVDAFLGLVDATSVTILFDSAYGVYYSTNFPGQQIFEGNLASEAPAGAVDRKWNPDSVDWSIPPHNHNPGANQPVYGLAMQPNDMTIAVGAFNSVNTEYRPGVVRLDTNGWVDPTFSPGGGPGPGPESFVQAVALYPTNSPHAGKMIVVGGFSSFDGQERNGIARLNADGSLDATFDPLSGADGPVLAVAIQSDDKIVIGGHFQNFGGSSRPFVARLNPNGTLDTNFNPGDGPDSSVWAIGLATNGGGSAKIVIGGEFIFVNGEFRSGIARLNSDGSPDITFNPATGVDGVVYALLVESNGRVLIGGSFTQIDLKSRNNIARLLPTGALDESFDPGSGANDAVRALHILPNGRILVGGFFDKFNDTRRMGLTRLYSNGWVDTEFLDTAYNENAGLGDPNSFVMAITAQSQGEVMIGGHFNSVGGTGAGFFGGGGRTGVRTRQNIARLVGGSTHGPGNVSFMLRSYRVDEDAGTLSAALLRTNGTLGPISVGGTTFDGSARAGEDYSSAVFSATWPSLWPARSPNDHGWMLSGGASNRLVFAPSISVEIIDDPAIEGDESFYLELAPPTQFLDLGGLMIPLGVALGQRRAEVTIVDDDVKHGAVAFSVPEYIVNENGTNVAITLTRTNGSFGAVSVDLITTNDSLGAFPAAAGSDYRATNMVVSFGFGQTSRTVLIPILNNAAVEEDETFLIQLSNPRGGVSIADSEVVVSIIDDDYRLGRLSFTQTNFVVNEAGLAAVISVARTGGSVSNVSATFLTIPGSATTSDYFPTNGVLSWSDGDTAVKTFQVQIVNDPIVETNESLRVVLTNFVGALPGLRTNAPLTIIEDDSYGAFRFSEAGYVVDEVGGVVTATILRDGSAGTVSVSVATRFMTGPGSATNTDFVTVNTNIIFAPGQVSAMVAIPIQDDPIGAEGDEAFSLILSNATGGAVVGNPGTALVTIVDNETTSGPAGSLDTEFAADAGTDGFVNALALEASGRIVIGGDFLHVQNANRARIARLNTNGMLDTTFSVGTGIDGPVRALAAQADGKVVVGGFFTRVNGTNRNHIVRLNSGGAVDLSFNPGSGADNPVNALALQVIGGATNIIAGGTFSAFNGVERRGVVRLTESGAVDLGFNPGLGANKPVYAIAVQPDGKVLVGGGFTTFAGAPHQGLVRLNTDGSIDPTFNLGVGANGEVRAIAVQVDGRIVFGGTFTDVSGVTFNGLARVNSDGSIDGSFNPGDASGPVLSIAVQPDGKLLVGGDFQSFGGVHRGGLTRLNPDGSNDPSINFGSGADSFVAVVVLQPDRRIVIGGGFTHVDGQPRNHIARLNGGSIAGAGELDFSLANFEVEEDAATATITVRRSGGTSGTVTAVYSTAGISATGGVDYQNASGLVTFMPGETRRSFTVTIQNDNIVELDETIRLSLTNLTGGAALGRNPSAILTIKSDDSLVRFSASAYQITEDFFTRAAVITVIRTGTLSGIVTVDFTTGGGTATTNIDYTPVAGRLVFSPGQTSRTFEVPIANDDFVEGDETVGLQLSSVTGDAALGDPSAAVLTITEDDFYPGDISFAAAQYLVGENSGTLNVTIVRTNGFTGVISVRYLTEDDTARGGTDFAAATGIITFSEGQTNQIVPINISPDDLVEGNERFFLVLTNTSGGAIIRGPHRLPITIEDDDVAPGSVDRDFDPGAGPNGLVRAVSVLSDNKVVIGGAFTSVGQASRPYVARLLANGPVDLDFNPGAGPDGFVAALDVLPDSRVVIGGSFSTVAGSSFNRVARLHTNGAVDMNFNRNPGFNGGVTTLASRDDGRIVGGGTFTLPTRSVAQLRADGSVDTAFNPSASANGPVQAVLISSNGPVDGQLLIGGSFTAVAGTSRSRVARFHLNGVLDDSFAPSQITNGTVYALGEQADGKIIVGGDFRTTLSGTNRVTLVRLNTDGSIDQTFQVGIGPNNIVYDLAIQPTGKILIGGAFTEVNGVSRNRFARLRPDGSLDPDFQVGSGANNTVFALELLPDDNIIIGGDFTTVGGVTRNRVARIFADESASLSLVGIDFVGSNPRIRMSGVAGHTYVLERSADLVTWTAFSTNTAVTSTLDVIDPVPVDGIPRFYRTRE